MRTTAHQRRKKGAKVGRQAHTMPMKGSTHDQTKTGDMVQVGSDDLTLFSRVMMRTTLAMQTLESGWLAWRNCFWGEWGIGERWIYKLPSSKMLTTASF